MMLADGSYWHRTDLQVRPLSGRYLGESGHGPDIPKSTQLTQSRHRPKTADSAHGDSAASQ